MTRKVSWFSPITRNATAHEHPEPLTRKGVVEIRDGYRKDRHDSPRGLDHQPESGKQHAEPQGRDEDDRQGPAADGEEAKGSDQQG